MCFFPGLVLRPDPHWDGQNSPWSRSESNKLSEAGIMYLMGCDASWRQESFTRHLSEMEPEIRDLETYWTFWYRRGEAEMLNPSKLTDSADGSLSALVQLHFTGNLINSISGLKVRTNGGVFFGWWNIPQLARGAFKWAKIYNFNNDRGKRG